MTKDLYDKLMVFGNDREPFLAHNFMRTTDPVSYTHLTLPTTSRV